MNNVSETTEQPITIEKLIPGGQGIATLPDGKRIFLWNALPSETVAAYEITKKKSKYCEAIATKIENPSPHRITPEDDCYLSTSPWQILDYPAELEQKALLLQETFRQHHVYQINDFVARVDTGGRASGQLLSSKTSRTYEEGEARNTRDGGLARRRFCKEELPLAPRPIYHYRNKMEYALYWSNRDQKIHLAFHQRGTHHKIPITKSSLEHPAIFQRAQKIIDNLNAHGEEARKYQSLLLRSDQAGHVSGGLLENFQPHPTFPPLSDQLLGHTYTYSVTGFFQINLPVYELVLQEIAAHIHTAKVLDLYAGVGTIGLSVAREHDLTLVEVNPLAYAELEKNCQTAQESTSILPLYHKSSGMSSINSSTPSNITPILAKSEDALDFIQPDQTVILDPPRAGCDIKLLDKLLLETPSTIIYLSCNPSTQARDLAILLAKYRIIKVQPYNFFPRTPHLENLVILHRI